MAALEGRDPDIPETPEERQRRINRVGAQRLRNVAAWLDAHPDAPTTEYAFPRSFYFRLHDAHTSEEAKAQLSRIGSFAKKYDDNDFTAEVTLPDAEPWREGGTPEGAVLQFFTDRKNVCTRRVVGTRSVPDAYIPGRLIPAHTEEVVEWDCSPILGDTPEEGSPAKVEASESQSEE
jgi:hypothetical protein